MTIDERLDEIERRLDKLEHPNFELDGETIADLMFRPKHDKAVSSNEQILDAIRSAVLASFGTDKESQGKSPEKSE